MIKKNIKSINKIHSKRYNDVKSEGERSVAVRLPSLELCPMRPWLWGAFFIHLRLMGYHERLVTFSNQSCTSYQLFVFCGAPPFISSSALRIRHCEETRGRLSCASEQRQFRGWGLRHIELTWMHADMVKIALRGK